MVLNLISPISSDPHLFSSLTMTDRTSLITVPGMTGIDILLDLEQGTVLRLGVEKVIQY
jgi:hypothetical protein